MTTGKRAWPVADDIPEPSPEHGWRRIEEGLWTRAIAVDERICGRSTIVQTIDWRERLRSAGKPAANERGTASITSAR